MIRLLADENIPPNVVRFLRDRGIEVKEVGVAGSAGATDDEIMSEEASRLGSGKAGRHCYQIAYS